MVDMNWQSTTWPSPTQYLQSVINANVAGTTYLLKDGIHRFQTMEFKDGDTLEFESVDAVLCGSEDISGGWTDNLDGTWSKTGITRSSATAGGSSFRTGYENRREWVIVDGEPLASRTADDLTSNPYCSYYTGTTFKINRDPTGVTVELARQTRAIFGRVDDVTIGSTTQDFKTKIYNYAASAQASNGAVAGGRHEGSQSQDPHPGNNWRYNNIEFTGNNGCAVGMCLNGVLWRCWVHRNGQLGVGTKYADNVQTEYNQVGPHNCIGGWSASWEGGNTKFANNDNNWDHGNYYVNEDHENASGTSAHWYDIDNGVSVDNLIEHNLIADYTIQAYSGSGLSRFGILFYEISLHCEIRHNVIIGSVKSHENPIWTTLTSAIIMSDSAGTSGNPILIHKNHIYGCSDGIAPFTNNRRGGTHHVQAFDNITVTDTSIQSNQRTGSVRFNSGPLNNLSFTDNAYFGIPGSSYSTANDHWREVATDNNQGSALNWSEWQNNAGHDVNGVVVAPSGHPITDPYPLNGGMAFG